MGENKKETRVISLQNDDGKMEKFEVFDTVLYEGERYLVLFSVEGCEKEPLILQEVRLQNGDKFLVSVEDEAILCAVGDIAREKCNNTYRIES